MLAALPHARSPKLRRRLLTLMVLPALSLLVSGCATKHPPPIGPRALEEAQTFPFYETYWVGHKFMGTPLAAADGTTGYDSLIGDSVYYGDCVHGKKVIGGTCALPLQVTTVIYRLHSNQTLGEQRNLVIRGVPATIYDEGHSIELYTGQVAIDIFSDKLAHALRAANELRPLNAPGSARGPLPPPVFCPGLFGSQDPELRQVMASLPGRVCQKTAEALAIKKSEEIP